MEANKTLSKTHLLLIFLGLLAVNVVVFCFSPFYAGMDSDKVPNYMYAFLIFSFITGIAFLIMARNILVGIVGEDNYDQKMVDWLGEDESDTLPCVLMGFFFLFLSITTPFSFIGNLAGIAGIIYFKK